MINLIKNELTKVFHKKSIYIMLIIMAAVTILGIILSIIFNDEVISSLENYTYDYEATILEEDLKNYDLSNETEKANYIVVKTEYLATKDRMKFKDTYKKNYVDEYAYDYIQCEVENEVNGNTEEAEECKQKHIEIVEEIEKHDWKYFVEKDLKEVKEKLKEPAIPGFEDIRISYETEEKALEYQLKYNISPNDRRKSIIDYYRSYRNTYLSYEKKEKILDEDEKKLYRTAKGNYKIAEYKLDNNILYDEYGSLVALDETYKGAGFFVIITIALIAGSIVSDEFNKGTIKQLLIRPHTRSKILLSKLITAFIVFIFVLLVHYLLNFVSSLVTGDAKEVFMPLLRYNFNADTVYKESLIVSLILGSLKILPCYLIIMTFSFLASTVTKNDALGILAGIGIYFGGNLLNVFLTIRKLWINNFIPTLCWDLNSYLSNYEPLSSIILPVIVDIVTIVAMLVVAFIVFKKTDIKNQ